MNSIVETQLAEQDLTPTKKDLAQAKEELAPIKKELATTTKFNHWMTDEQLEEFGKELTALREETLKEVGQEDADYIRSIIRKQRVCEISGRTLIHFSINPITWLAGVGLLSVSKIMENMEIGHNVMHGQYDWMNDPKLNSQTYEWDTVCDSESWRKTHNYEHHTYTNILGKDRDYGYAVLRLSDDTPWKPRHLFQFINYGLLSVFFQWGVGLHELESERIRRREISLKEKIPFLKRISKKASRQVFKDYILFPLLAGPFALKVLAGNALANLGRNLWASTIIFCGHFTQDAHTFTQEECENESQGAWYLRQMLGSSNFTGGRWLHIMSGHLSYQIEHHLFPDIPAHRYPKMSLKVKEICDTYGVPYNTNSFGKQYFSVLKRILQYSLPDKNPLPKKAIPEKALA